MIRIGWGMRCVLYRSHCYLHRNELTKNQADAARYPNVSLHPTYLPEMFGTHHSKMLILLRRDDTAQVIIHTANMIPRDWTNMTQAVWSSPMLPLLPSGAAPPEPNPPIGSGAKFKIDLLNYLLAYQRRACKPIADKLARYDFSAVRGALIASVPGRFRLASPAPTRWGWAALKEALAAVPVRSSPVPKPGSGSGPKPGPQPNPGKACIAIQISSIATLGPTDTWLRNTLFPALSTSTTSSSPSPSTSSSMTCQPEFKIIFPTPDEIRRSLDGYASGGSIHTKTQSPQQAKQLAYLRPLFCHWANDCERGAEVPGEGVLRVRDAGRKRAAPHVKTYVRFAPAPTPAAQRGEHSKGGDEDGDHDGEGEGGATGNGDGDVDIDWALVTSANLSKQAWGEARNTAGEMRISSYEIGVLVWPGLFGEGAVMKGAFRSDTVSEEGAAQGGPVVSLRMPYSLPLQAYGKGETPWVATASYTELDWMGRMWRNG